MKCPTCKAGGYVTNGHCTYCGTSFMPEVTSPNSQKVAGILELPKVVSSYHGKTGYTPVRPLNVVGVVQAREDITDHLSPFFPLFARPCPTVPRHGFVDSRVVSSVEDLKQVWDETVAADPGGEVLLCEFITAKMNAIITPTMLTMGAGYDGATSGKDTINIPLMRRDWFEERKETHGYNHLLNARIKRGDDPYFEVVADDHVSTLTQLRGGPRLETGSPDFIPSRIVVSQIIKVDPKMSLLDWEKLIQEKAGVEGLVIYHPGGSPVDHFSVHARSFGIPVVTTFEPIQGVELEPIPQIPLNPLSIIEGIAVADQWMYDQDFFDEAELSVAIALMMLHNSAAFQGKDGFWLGLGVGFMIRLGTTAMAGEARHCRKDYGEHTEGRETVYKRVINQSLNTHRLKLTQLTHILRYGTFSSSGIGGPAWATCGLAVGKLINAVGAVARGEEGSVGELLRAYNICVNQAHNGGWWLNKFAVENLFVDAQDGNPILIAHTLPLLWKLAQKRGTADLSKTKYQRWRPLLFKPVRPLSVEITSGVPGPDKMLEIKPRDRILAGREKTIIVYGSQLQRLMWEKVNTHLTLRADEKGRSLIFNPGPIVLWEEKPLDIEANKPK